jgi:hypothetical protein
MSKFVDIPERGCDTVTPAWWNILRLAGIRLEQILGSAIYPETQQSITDSSSATNITGLLLNSTLNRAAKIHLTYTRDDGTNQRRGWVDIYVWYNSKRAAWGISVTETGEDCTAGACVSAGSGLTFTITSGGQVQVASDSMGGTHVGKIRWKVISTFDVES